MESNDENFFKTVGAEAAARLLWRMGNPLDREWLQSKVPHSVLTSWGPVVPAGVPPRTTTYSQEEITAALQRFLNHRLDAGAHVWEGTPIALFSALGPFGIVVPAVTKQHTGFLGRILSQWPVDAEVPLNFTRTFGQKDRRCWKLEF